MARLSLSNRAQRYGSTVLADPGSLSKRNLGERAKLLSAMGVDASTWNAWKPATRRRYVAAARRGNTIADERERVRDRRKATKAAKSPRPRRAEMTRQDKAYRIEELRQKLIELLDTRSDEQTVMDALESDILLSVKGVRDHIAYYGYDYVLEQLEEMDQSIEGYLRDDRSNGRNRWSVFTLSPKYRQYDGEDERWYWYHTRIY